MKRIRIAFQNIKLNIIKKNCKRTELYPETGYRINNQKLEERRLKDTRNDNLKHNFQKGVPR